MAEETKDIAVLQPDGTTHKIPRDTSEVELGQWFWVKFNRRDGSEDEWLGCVMQIGSNFVEVQAPESSYGYSHDRVHFDDFWTRLRYEPDAERIIQDQIAHYRDEVNDQLTQIKALTARLGVSPQTALAHSPAPGANNAGALTVVTSAPDLDGYKAELILAKEKTLPELFKGMEASNRELARWMTAPTLPLKAQMMPMRETIERIDGAIFNISLYAGLVESAVPVNFEADDPPEPAGFTDKLHVMQRRLYMDEECLLNYRTGGMSFKEVEEFDEWLSETENRDRILPFPRCCVAFRVRRFDRELPGGIGLMSAFISMQMKDQDKITYLYVRNGEQIWRIQTEIDFGPKLFPDADSLDPAEMMVEMFGSSVKGFMPKREFEVRKAEEIKRQAENDRLRAEWKEANPDVKNGSFHNPHWYSAKFEWKKYVPFDPTSVYYDDASKEINAKITAYNRIGLILQGLFDRSPVLHPPPPVQTWTPRGFEQSMSLIYDGSGSALYAGEKPDFDAYRERLNASITVGTIVVGQDDYWSRVEAAKENKRINRGGGREMHYTRYRPYGDPGPGYIGPVPEIRPRARVAVFRWEKPSGWRAQSNFTKRALEVPLGKLFNVEAYTPGDYKQFFADPRTREEYLRWAPLLLAAEDWHAGKADRHKDAKEGNSWE